MELAALKWKDNILYILNQTKLPHKIEYIKCRTKQDVLSAIVKMKIRGAPALGVVSAYGIALSILNSKIKDFNELKTEIDKISEIFIATRPTAVNIKWAVERMKKIVINSHSSTISIEKIKKKLLNEARKIHKEDIEINKKIAEFGSLLIYDGDVILTHCNAGSLATGGWGTALGVIKTACNQGKKITVFVDETRPLFQGARLTTFELKQSKIPHYLICDNTAGYFIKQGIINKIITGADRIARNGDTANKIGTYTLSILAKENKIPFYIAAPTSTFDINIKSGQEVIIEERDEKEILYINKNLIAPKGTKVKNPAFDITPNKYITAIITEKGIIKRPYIKNIKQII